MGKKIPLVTLVMLLRDFSDNESIKENIKNVVNEKTVQELSEFDPSILYEIASKIDDIDSKKIVESVILTEDLEYMYRLARIREDWVWDLARAVIDLKNPRYIYTFLISFDNAPKEELKEALAASGDMEYIYKLAQFEIMKQLNETDDIGYQKTLV